MHRGTRCPLGFTRARGARRQATPTDLARRRTARSRSIHSAHPETVPGLPWPRDRGSFTQLDRYGLRSEKNYSQAQLNELDSLTERWVADPLRNANASKTRKRTRHS